MALRPAWVLLVTTAAGIAATSGVASAGTLDPGQHPASAHQARHTDDSDWSGAQRHRGGHEPDGRDDPEHGDREHHGDADHGHAHADPATSDVVSTPFNNLG